MSQYKQYYTVYKDRDWETLPQIHQVVMNSWKILKSLLQAEELVRYSNGWNPLPSQLKITKIKEWHKKQGRKARKKPQWLLPESLKPTNLPRKEKRIKKEIGGNHIHPITGSKNMKRCYGQFC
ncbi:hypothetical protein O181_108528 [Austropuccinia psidii MF-1]|uniref:Uncharacterized protein n=1 Tax=Austropuccinia psidii MF-1 TaxID=1389203 RepID=A0A9Q3JUF3_9BASI|nr:hypothetical protein [Austropuccinia psidii MF-1]